MSRIRRVLSALFGGAPRKQATPPADRPRPGARYDSAATTTENAPLWRNADALSATAANSPDVRRTLRNRSRYEIENNGYAGGLVEGRTNDTIGTGPRLQLNLPELEPDAVAANPLRTTDAARRTELRFAEWAEATGFAEKLRVLDLTETRDGEAFALFVVNPGLPPDGPQLDLLPIEADQVCDPEWTGQADPNNADGVFCDALGNATRYRILRRHPGDAQTWAGTGFEFDDYGADRVIHLFARKRPGQKRGIPALTPSLPLYGQIRRYTSAVLGAAELAAELGGVLTQETGPHDPDGAEVEADSMDVIPFRRRMLLTLAAGQDVKAFDPAQPAPSYDEFKTNVLTEAGRAISAPENVSTGTSAKYNYSSGRLDHLPWQRSIRIRRDRLRRVVLDRVFRAWLDEARRIPGYLPAGLPADPRELRWKWRWDGFDSIDPVKDATAAEIRLRAGLSTLEDECGSAGGDWEETVEQRARERKRLEEAGLLAGEVESVVTTQDADGSSVSVASKSKPAVKAAGAPDVQATALNGAQVTAMVTMCNELVGKRWTAAATEAALQISFPAADRDLIRTMVSELEKVEPPEPEPEPAAPAEAGEDA